MSSLSLPTFIDDATMQIKNLYFSVGEVRQNQWDRLLDIVGDNPYVLWGYGSWFVFIITYWLVGGVYTFFDITNKPLALRQYKVQPGTNEPITKRNLIKILSLVLFNQIVVTIPCTWYLGQLMVKKGSPHIRKLPPFYKTVVDIIILVLIEEILFYYSHRFTHQLTLFIKVISLLIIPDYIVFPFNFWSVHLPVGFYPKYILLLHHRRIYKYIHKKHHEWTAPIAVVALYANPIEHIFSNLLPPVIGVLILKSHISTAWLWFGLAIAFTLSEHSGYHLPFFPSSEAHDFHHFKFTNCYGVLGLLDWLHGTDLEFKKTMSYTRHRVLKSLTSARDLFPDLGDNKSKKKN